MPRGGKREGAGRPSTGVNPSHHVRATAEQWEVIKKFIFFTKKNLVLAREIVENFCKEEKK